MKGVEKRKPENDEKEDVNEQNKVIHEIVNSRWEVCVTVSDKGFQHSSFVNSIATTKVQYRDMNYYLSHHTNKLFLSIVFNNCTTAVQSDKRLGHPTISNYWECCLLGKSSGPQVKSDNVIDPG